MLDRPMAFLATTKPDEARAFFTEALGFTALEDSPFALVFDMAGTMLRVQRLASYDPPQHTLFGWQVGDIAGTVDALAARGVAFMEVPGLPQDERAIWTTPDGARVAWFKTPDGETLSLTQLPA